MFDEVWASKLLKCIFMIICRVFISCVMCVHGLGCLLACLPAGSVREPVAARRQTYVSVALDRIFDLIWQCMHVIRRSERKCRARFLAEREFFKTRCPTVFGPKDQGIDVLYVIQKRFEAPKLWKGRSCECTLPPYYVRLYMQASTCQTV